MVRSKSVGSSRLRKGATTFTSVSKSLEQLWSFLTPVTGLFCPFAHRANLIRHLKGLTDIITMSVVRPFPKGDAKGWPGWKFPTAEDPYEAATVDHLFGSAYLHEIYFKDKKDYEGNSLSRCCGIRKPVRLLTTRVWRY